MRSFRQHISESMDIPWGKPHAGWYNPLMKKGMTFEHRYGTTGNYHITQVVRNPAFFGLDKSRVLEIIAKNAEELKRTPEEMYDRLADGRSDTSWRLSLAVYQNGWVQTRHANRSLDLVGYGRIALMRTVSLASLHVASLMDSGSFRVQVYDNEAKAGKTFEDMESMERYIKGR